MQKTKQPAKNPPTPALPTHPEYDAEFLKFWGEKPERKAGQIYRQIRNHYKADQWDFERVGRLCRMANCSPQVLFASIGFHPGPLAVSEWWERKKVPIGIAIQLAKFESYLVQRRFGYVPNTGPDDQALADIVAGKLTP